MNNRSPSSALIVAASADLRDGLHSLLTVNPLVGTVTHASDGQSALRSIEDHCPALVLLDFDLPHEDVQGVLRAMKERCPCTPCLAFTDHTEKREEIRSAGADVVLSKGYPAARVMTTVSDMLGQG